MSAYAAGLILSVAFSIATLAKENHEKLLGDWRLASVDGKASCSIKLQPLQGYGYGQVWANQCRFDGAPKIFSWRVDGKTVTLHGLHGKGDVGTLNRIGKNTFKGSLITGETVRMTR